MLARQKTGCAGRRRQGNAKGNMLVLMVVVSAVVLLLLLMLLSLASLPFRQNRLKAIADETALEAALKLNDLDRIGQFNNMTARCRQLVFDSRYNLDHCSRQSPYLVNFADDLLEETRQDAWELENERMRLRRTIVAEAQQKAEQRMSSLTGMKITLPWLTVGTPQFDVNFGNLAETTCKASNNRFLVLPPQNSFLPCACRVTLKVKVSSNLFGSKLQDHLVVTATAVTTGGGAQMVD